MPTRECTGRTEREPRQPCGAGCCQASRVLKMGVMGSGTASGVRFRHVPRTWGIASLNPRLSGFDPAGVVLQHPAMGRSRTPRRPTLRVPPASAASRRGLSLAGWRRTVPPRQVILPGYSPRRCAETQTPVHSVWMGRHWRLLRWGGFL